MKRKIEQGTQIQFIEYVREYYKDILFTIAPNGMKLPIWVAAAFKRMGYTPGTPDIMFFEPRGRWKGLFIEMKSPDGVLSKEQKRFLLELEKREYMTQVCHSVIEAISTLENYLRLNNNP